MYVIVEDVTKKECYSYREDEDPRVMPEASP